MPQPCIGSKATVLRISRSSVPCKISAFLFTRFLPRHSTGAILLFSCRMSRGTNQGGNCSAPSQTTTRAESPGASKSAVGRYIFTSLFGGSRLLKASTGLAFGTSWRAALATPKGRDPSAPGPRRAARAQRCASPPGHDSGAAPGKQDAVLRRDAVVRVGVEEECGRRLRRHL